MTEIDLIEKYRKKFGEKPPVFGYGEDEWPQLVVDAINSGTPLPDPADELPDGAVL